MPTKSSPKCFLASDPGGLHFWNGCIPLPLPHQEQHNFCLLLANCKKSTKLLYRSKIKYVINIAILLIITVIVVIKNKSSLLFQVIAQLYN